MALVNRNLHERERRRDSAGAAAKQREEEVEALSSSFRLCFRRGRGHRRFVGSRRRRVGAVRAVRGGSALWCLFTVVPASSRVGELLVYNLDAPTASGDELYALQRAQRVFWQASKLAAVRH